MPPMTRRGAAAAENDGESAPQRAVGGGSRCRCWGGAGVGGRGEPAACGRAWRGLAALARPGTANGMGSWRGRGEREVGKPSSPQPPPPLLRQLARNRTSPYPFAMRVAIPAAGWIEPIVQGHLPMANQGTTWIESIVPRTLAHGKPGHDLARQAHRWGE
eukprot:366040-Chlamydomonas_euryale.AAC.5